MDSENAAMYVVMVPRRIPLLAVLVSVALLACDRAPRVGSKVPPLRAESWLSDDRREPPADRGTFIVQFLSPT